jgi:GDPmannose 4,6-dehydratase
MKTALVTGVSGQDGSYAAQLLLERGYRVFGTVRSAAAARNGVQAQLMEQIELVEWNLLDQEALVHILSTCRPAEIYNFAAYSSGAGMFDDPVAISEINGLAVTRILEAIRSVDRKIRFCQASSSEMFGDIQESPQTEETRFLPRSPYGAAKLYAHNMLHIYRQRYEVFACSAILFNHESPRRGLGFVTRKITSTAAKIKLGMASSLSLGNLDARRDWGFAGDYVRAMWMMLQDSTATDYVVATGQTSSVRDLCEVAFSMLDLDYRQFVLEDPSLYRPVEPTQLVGRPEKLKMRLGWQPQVDFSALVEMMVREDMAACKKRVN